MILFETVEIYKSFSYYIAILPLNVDKTREYFYVESLLNDSYCNGNNVDSLPLASNY